MYSVPPSASEPTKEGIKMENMAASPADPLLTSNVQVVTQTHKHTDTESAEFHIAMF